MADHVTQRPFRVAVASDDDAGLVQRFGHATRFLVYDLIDSEFFLVDDRASSAACGGGGEGHHDDRLERVVAVIDDCDVVLVREIGPGAVRVLQRHGLSALISEESVDQAISSLAARSPRVAGTIDRGVHP